jgi:hypothetical protein
MIRITDSDMPLRRDLEIVYNDERLRLEGVTWRVDLGGLHRFELIRRGTESV